MRRQQQRFKNSAAPAVRGFKSGSMRKTQLEFSSAAVLWFVLGNVTGIFFENALKKGGQQGA